MGKMSEQGLELGSFRSVVYQYTTRAKCSNLDQLDGRQDDYSDTLEPKGTFSPSEPFHVSTPLILPNI